MTIRHYRMRAGRDGFRDMFLEMRDDLAEEKSFAVGEWQSQKIDMAMRELLNVCFSYNLPSTAEELARQTGARLPWAEDHFLERVGGEPLNPSPSEAWWPFAKKRDDSTNADHKSEGEAFSHTYPERMWPKMANGGQESTSLKYDSMPHQGIRFEYGDLNDVVDQLVRQPNTRQAYLPIWFPEDTGAVHGKRVPCTLGYHFMIREGVLNISYFMRSTDLLRHFQDDVYLAGRLAQWVVERINENYADEGTHSELGVGELIFHTANMHIFEGDTALIDYWKSQGKAWF